MDRNDSETFATLFTSDGKIEIKKTKLIFDSPEKLKKLCSNIYNQFSPALHLVLTHLDSLMLANSLY